MLLLLGWLAVWLFGCLLGCLPAMSVYFPCKQITVPAVPVEFASARRVPEEGRWSGGMRSSLYMLRLYFNDLHLRNVLSYVRCDLPKCRQRSASLLVLSETWNLLHIKLKTDLLPGTELGPPTCANFPTAHPGVGKRRNRCKSQLNFHLRHAGISVEPFG